MFIVLFMEGKIRVTVELPLLANLKNELLLEASHPSDTPAGQQHQETAPALNHC